MSEWGVVGVVIALVALVAAVAGPMIKLNTAITTLTVTMKSLEGSITEQTAKNTKSHDRIWSELNSHDDKLGGHESRIIRLEERK